MKAILRGTILVGAILWLPLTTALADDPPRLEVEFLMTPLPETLGLENPQSPLAVKIANELRDEATRLLNRVFPFVEWVAASATATADESEPAGCVTFVMQADSGIGQRVYIEASKRLPNSAAEKKLDIFARDVYPDGSNFPSPSEVEAVTLNNAKSALEEMIASKSLAWQDKLTRHIPLSQRVAAEGGLKQALVVPLKAKQLKASSDSVLLVAFSVKVQDEPQQDGEIKLHPLQPVYEPENQYFEMQDCDVSYYHYHPIKAMSWHPHILVALSHLAPMTTLKVFMIDYKRADEDRIDNHF